MESGNLGLGSDWNKEAHLSTAGAGSGALVPRVTSDTHSAIVSPSVSSRWSGSCSSSSIAGRSGVGGYLLETFLMDEELVLPGSQVQTRSPPAVGPCLAQLHPTCCQPGWPAWAHGPYQTGCQNCFRPCCPFFRCNSHKIPIVTPKSLSCGAFCGRLGLFGSFGPSLWHFDT